MAVSIVQLVEKLFKRNPDMPIQNLLQSLKGYKHTKQDCEITFYTEKKNAPTLDLQSGCFYGKTALIIWVDTEELNLALKEANDEQNVN